jgi:digeranylgeranylglycerophospholipid reductase
MEQTHVTIIGGGPAGCAAACTLADQGYSGILIERGRQGRDKACGDAFLVGAMEALSRIWKVSLPELEKQLSGLYYPFTQAIISISDQQITTEQNGIGWVFPRAISDRWMQEHIPSSIPLRYETTVIEINSDEHGYILTVRRGQEISYLQSKTVIIATGSNSRLSQMWKLNGNALKAVSVRGYVEDTPPSGLLFQYDAAYPAGYAWKFPVSHNRINIGIISFRHPRQLLRQFNQLCSSYGTASQVLGSGLAIWSGQGTTWHHCKGMVSCGDAAGLVDPVSGGGIPSALLSGEQAGLAIAAYLKNGDEQTLKKYSSWVEQFGTIQFQMTPGRKMLYSLN